MEDILNVKTIFRLFKNNLLTNLGMTLYLI